MKHGFEQVVFGHMHEDHSIELSLVESLPLKRALLVASGGDLAFALAAGKVEVTAVDCNPAQVGLVRMKMSCPENLMELCSCGRVDRVLRWCGPFLAWLMDWPRNKPGGFRRFLTNRLECGLAVGVSLIHGSRAGRKLDRAAIRLIRGRLELAMRRPDAESNPWLLVLMGEKFDHAVPEVWSVRGIDKWKGEVDRIALKTGDFMAVLAETPDASLGLISASNLPDVMAAEGWNQLVGLAAESLASGGYLIGRSMLRESLVSENDGRFWVETNLQPDISPLCPVVWIGRKR